jgi:hypothetical protein
MRIFDCNKWQLRGFLANNIKILKVHLSEHCDVYLKKAYNVLRFTVRCSNEESFDMISFLILTIFTRFLKNYDCLVVSEVTLDFVKWHRILQQDYPLSNLTDYY